jgi:hypothetical protein
MSTIKSICGPSELFTEAQTLANELKISLSEFICQAIRNQIDGLENKQGWSKLNLPKQEVIKEVIPLTNHIPIKPEIITELNKTEQEVKPIPKKCYRCKFESKSDHLECSKCGHKVDNNGTSMKEVMEIQA